MFGQKTVVLVLSQNEVVPYACVGHAEVYPSLNAPLRHNTARDVSARLRDRVRWARRPPRAAY